MQRRIRHLLRKDDERWTFFRQWLKNPLSIAAISPSSQRLAELMIEELPPDASRVVELGGGTGVFTRALLQSGIAPSDLLVLELNEELHQHLRRRFPAAHVVCGDARQLVDEAQRSGYSDGGPADAVISGLGLLSMPRPLQQAILEAAFGVLRPEGRFIQFTYGPTSPVAKEVLETLGLGVRRAGVAWRNMPPATVYVYTRHKSRGLKPRSMRKP